MEILTFNQCWILSTSFASVLFLLTICEAEIVLRRQLRNELPINLTSPRYPTNYENDEDIAWHISAPAGVRILAKLGFLSLERNKDYLRFGDGHGRELIQLTGKYSPPGILSPADVMWINFTSDASSTDRGFWFELSTFNRSGVRLTDGTTPFNGRVEVYSPTYGWSTVSDNQWNLKDATTLCRELGLPGASHALSNAHFGEGSGTVLMSDIDCSNDHFLLEDCPHQGPCFGCSHRQDAGVICHRPNYLGCFYLPNIAGQSIVASSTEDCISECDKRRFQYAALNGNQCYCRASITFPKSPEDDASCNSVCTGSPNEACGSDSDSSVFSVYDTQFASCDNPGTPHNATRRGSGFHFGSKVTFNCSEGFELIGNWEIRCVAGDSLLQPKWTSTIPYCSALVDNSTQLMNATATAQAQTTNNNVLIPVVLAVIFSLLFLILLLLCAVRCQRRGSCRRKPKKMEMWY